MRNYDDRYLRDRRAFDLAWRMIGHGARTSTISRWTGLPERRIRRLQRTYGIQTGGTLKRPRGRSPYRVEFLLRSPRVRKEAVGFARLCRDAGVLAGRFSDDARSMRPGIVKGESLCGVFEAFKIACPDPTMTIEQAFLLVTALLCGEEIDLTACASCQEIAIIDLLKLELQHCETCGSALKIGADSDSQSATSQTRSSPTPSSTSDRNPARLVPEPTCSLATSSTCKHS
jgi:hypothetical protein